MMNGPIDMSGERVNMPPTDSHQVITGAAVEAAAKVSHQLQEGGITSWARGDQATRDRHLDAARQILEAAAAHMLAQGWDEGVAYVFEGGSEVSDENPYRPTP